MAYLEVLESGKRFNITDRLTVISNDVVPDIKSIALKDKTIQFKHAAIVISNGIHQLFDICSNGTSLKTMGDVEFKVLATMQPVTLRHGDEIRFGNVNTKFYNNDIIEFSHLTQVPQQQTLGQSFFDPNNNNESVKHSFFAPATQSLDAADQLTYDEQSHVQSDEINLLETQDETGLLSSYYLENLLDIVCANDDESNDVSSAMSSQNFLLDISSSSVQNFERQQKGPIVTECVILVQALNFVTAQKDFFTPIELSQFVDKERLPLSEILMHNDTTSEGNNVSSSFHDKPKQSEINTPIVQYTVSSDDESKTVSLTDFDDAKDYGSSTKKIKFTPRFQPKVTDENSEDDSDDGLPMKFRSLKRSTQESQPNPDTGMFNSDATRKEFNISKPAIKRRRLSMMYISDSEDESAPTTSVKAKSKAIKMNCGPPNAKKLKKPAMVEEYVDHPKPLEIVGQPMTQQPLKPVKKFYSIAITNISDSELIDKYEDIIKSLGGRFVKTIVEADLLLTDETIKCTVKFLAAVCKSIPIVGRDFLYQSQSAKQWLDPNEFILHDAEFETRRQINLRDLLRNTANEKFLRNYSVFVTKNTLIKPIELAEIIENAGGECIDNTRQKPTNENVAMISNKKDKHSIERLLKIYPNIKQIVDSNICTAVLTQKI